MLPRQLFAVGAVSIILGATLASAGDAPSLNDRARDTSDRVAETAPAARAGVRTGGARLNTYYVAAPVELCEATIEADAPQEPSAAETKEFIIKKATWEEKRN
jgi:hypothetical protein